MNQDSKKSEEVVPLMEDMNGHSVDNESYQKVLNQQNQDRERLNKEKQQ